MDRVSKDSSRRAYVVVLSGDRMGETFALGEGRTAIGRGLHADVRVNDEGISRTHAEIQFEGGEYMLNDAGSTNGTFANGSRVDAPHLLREGDKVQIGATSVLKFTFKEDEDDDLQRSLYESALRDRLTGVFNRGYFNNRLESDVAFAMRHGKPLSLVMFEVDEFKAVADAQGETVGDGLLQALAQRVQRTTRSEDIFARYSGEAFVLICRDVDALRASKAAHRIQSLVRGEAFAVEGKEHQLTVSLGVADLAMLHQPSAKALVEAADTALFVAKRQGQDRVEIFDPESEPTRLV